MSNTPCENEEHNWKLQLGDDGRAIIRVAERFNDGYEEYLTIMWECRRCGHNWESTEIQPPTPEEMKKREAYRDGLRGGRTE